jgi:ubiquinone/menaquinone biosynthesis C-methylase UbiE
MRSRLRLRRGDLVADVGGGTGLSAELFLRNGVKVVLVDYSVPMLKQARARLGRRVRYLRAAAEYLPLRDTSVHVVSSAQSFHWFNAGRTLSEFARVLRKGGGLALFWNDRLPHRHPFLRAYQGLIRRFNPRFRGDYRFRMNWTHVISRSKQFRDVHFSMHEHAVPFTRRRFGTYARSVSYIRNVLSAARLHRFLHDLRALLYKHFRRGSFELPYATSLWTARYAGKEKQR